MTKDRFYLKNFERGKMKRHHKIIFAIAFLLAVIAMISLLIIQS